MRYFFSYDFAILTGGLCAFGVPALYYCTKIPARPVPIMTYYYYSSYS